jgi:indole-3-glycerol phosphate synthase
VGRFSQAIAEGDGISLIPMLEGDVERLAAVAEAAGAEAVAVSSLRDAERARAATALPVLFRGSDVEAVSAAGAGVDACVLAFETPGWGGERNEQVEERYALALELGLDCAVDVADEDALEQALERLDPEIVLIAERDPERIEEELERTLDLLPDVPAGKLVVSACTVRAREQVLALERAGVDALLLGPGSGDLQAVVAELSGRAAE